MTEEAGLSPAPASGPAETAVPEEGGQTATPGGMLAARRADRGLAVTDVAQRLKFGVRQIEALEADDFAQLPSGTFVRGMIRGYARMLEMDPAPVLASLDRVHVATPEAIEPRAAAIPFPGAVKRSNRVFVLLSAVIVLLAAFLLYEWQFGPEPAGSPEQRAEAVAAAAPAVASAAADTAGVASASAATPLAAASTGSPAMASASTPLVVPASASAPAPTAPSPAPSAKSSALPAYAAQASAAAAPPADARQAPPAAAPKPSPAAASAPQAPAVSALSADKNGRLAAAPLPGAMPVSATSSTAAASAPGKAGQLSLRFDQDAWVQIRQADGKVLMAQLNRGGTEQVVEGTPPFNVIIGNAPSVRLTYNNATVDLRPYFKVDVARLTLD